MSIRRKFFLTLLTSLMALSLFFAVVSTVNLRNSTRSQLRTSMETLVSFNTSRLNSFMTSIHQVALHLVSDKAFGDLLSFSGKRVIDQIENRDALYIQFTHYSLFFNTEYNNFENTLFLDASLPAASMFPVADMKKATRQGSYRIYRDTLVKDEPWYKAVKNKNIATHAVYDDESGKLLFVRRLQNTYYTGPWRKDGIGTMVISISPDDLVDLLSMSFLTPNSAYIIRNSNDDVLLQKNAHALLTNPEAEKELHAANIPASGKTMRLGKKDYEVYSRLLRNDLQIIYLTPMSDVRALIWQSLKPNMLLSGAFLLVTILASYLFSAYFTRPIIKLSSDISEIRDTMNYDPAIFRRYKDREMQVLCRSFESMLTNSKRLNEARQESERKSREMELRSLQAQINPHFLFNAMDLVNWLALSRDQNDIADIVGNIAEILRYSITEADSLIPVRDELRICRTYLSIYRLRYGNLMELSTPPLEELDYYIPKFCLQPLVENSIRHSSETHEAALFIELTHLRLDDMIELRLSDNGMGKDPELLNRFLAHEPDVNLKVSHGFGIRNVNERLRLKFRGAGSLHYEIDGKGRLTAVLRFPYITDKHGFLKGDQD